MTSSAEKAVGSILRSRLPGATSFGRQYANRFGGELRTYLCGCKELAIDATILVWVAGLSDEVTIGYHRGLENNVTVLELRRCVSSNGRFIVVDGM